MNNKFSLKCILKYFLITLLVLIIISGFTYLFFKNHTVYKKIRDYNKCIEAEYYQESIKHFPKYIPKDVKEANLYCVPCRFELDGALILLKLKVDKEYIKNEMLTHKFLNTKTPIGTVQKIYHMPTEIVGIPKENVTFYVLKNKENEKYYKEYFPYFTGIGIDKNYEYIIYYYIKPD